jgi:hypothetical protein
LGENFGDQVSEEFAAIGWVPVEGADGCLQSFEVYSLHVDSCAVTISGSALSEEAVACSPGRRWFLDVLAIRSRSSSLAGMTTRCTLSNGGVFELALRPVLRLAYG